MLHFEMNPDPQERPVRAFPGPLGTNILVVGDLRGQLDNRPIIDRVPVSIIRDDVERVQKFEKLAPNILELLKNWLSALPAAVNVDVINATVDDLVCDFEDSPTLRKSGFFQRVNQYNHQGMRPYSLVVFLDAVKGYLLQQLALVGRGKNVPILVEAAEPMAPSKPEAKFIVPCSRGALVIAGEIIASFRSAAILPNLTTCAGTSLASLLWLTRFAQQILHIDHLRGSPSQTSDPQAMMDIINGALATRLRHRPEISAQIRSRRLMMPPFHGQRMRAYGETMSRLTRELTNVWAKGHEVSVYDVAQRISLDVIMQVI